MIWCSQSSRLADHTTEAVRHGLADVEQLELGVDLMPAEDREAVRERLKRVFAQIGRRTTA
jgi:hypothetical protein